MKLPLCEFRKLQQAWYQKLEDLGFKDIEELKEGELVLKQSSNYCYRKTNAFEIAMKEEYFRCISQKAQDEKTVYRNEVDKHILVRHSEGARIKVIIEELLAKGASRDRKSIRIIIRRYEMAWGLKHYTPKQLNKKTKND